MSETCSTCKFWQPPELRTGWGDPVTYHVPDGPKRSFDYEREASLKFGICSAIKIQDDLAPDDPLPLAATRDASSFVADLYTQAEFGCRMHEPEDIA